MKCRSGGVPALVVLFFSASGCSEDVGSCDDPSEARDTVLVGGSVQYAGQAIINQSCAGRGCHSSLASGEARSGVPKGYDFNLSPAKPGGESANDEGEKIAKITSKDRDGLRARQRRVVEQRDRIWEQVSKDLMPPDDAFSARRALSALFDSDESDVCTRSSTSSFEPITSSASKEVLRNWLACGAPIVETNTEFVTAQTAGTVGYQVPECAVEAQPNTLEYVQSVVFDEYCASCHPGTNDLELDNADNSFAALVEDKSDACKGKPFVTPGNLGKSYLYDLVTKDDPGCHDRMPYGGDPLSDAEIKIIADWIAAGAGRAR